MLSVLKYTLELVVVLNHFSDCMVSVKREKHPSIFQALIHFSFYEFLLLRFLDFFGEYLLISPFSANHQKRNFSSLWGQVFRFFREFY